MSGIHDEPCNHVSCPSHCCIRHGCKYGYPCCPVALGEIAQEFQCEDCEADKPDYEPIDGYVWCDRRGSVHVDSLNPFAESVSCEPEDHLPIYRSTEKEIAL